MASPRFKSPVGGTRNNVPVNGIYVAVVEHVQLTTTSTRAAGMARVTVPFFRTTFDYAPVGGQSPRDPLVKGDFVYVTFLNGRRDQLAILGRVDHQGDVFAPTSHPTFTGNITFPESTVEGSGQILGPASGSALHPSYSFSDDPNTGIYRPDIDTVGISTAGYSRVVIDEAGRVGIGTDNPTTTLHVTGTATITNGLIVEGNLTVEGGTTTIESTTLVVDDKNIVLGSVATPSDTTADGGGITLKGATDKTIVWVNSKDAWDFNQGINVTGSVSITGGLTVGTSNAQILGPASGSHDTGEVSYSFKDDPDTGFYRSDHNIFHAATAGATRMTWGATGNVGIGQSAPVATLGVEASADPWMHIVDTGTGTQLFGVDGTAAYIASDTKPIYFKQGCTWNAHPGDSGSTVMTITTAGDVGINDATPSYKLDVNGTGRFVGNLYLEGANGVQGPSSFYVHNGGGEEILFQDSSDQLFFKTNAIWRCYVSASGHFLPYVDNAVASGTYDLGASSNRWKGLYAVTGNFTGAVTLDSVAISNVDTANTFTNNDVSIMTSAAIADKIESYNYTTVSGEITEIVTSTGISGGTASGTATLSIDADQSQVTAVGTLGSLNVTGNVGVGTTTPVAKLSVTSGSTNSSAHFGRYDDEGLFLHSDAQASHYNWRITTNTVVDTGFEIAPSTAVGGTTWADPLFVIKQNGSVGIGITTPSQKFHQSGGKHIVDSTDNSWGQLQVGNPNTGEAAIMYLSHATGYGGSPSSTSGTSHQWIAGAGPYGVGGNKWSIGNANYAGVIFTVTHDGKVGIGTTTPAAPLQVNTTASDAATIQMNTTHASSKRTRLQFAYGGTQGWEWGTDLGANGGTELYAYNRATAVIAMVIKDDGKIGIGTNTPGDQLHVYEAGTGAAWRGRALFGGQTNVVVAGEYNGVASIGAHNAALNAWAALVINEGGGNVGIGFPAPSYRLSINGSLFAGTNTVLAYTSGIVGIGGFHASNMGSYKVAIDSGSDTGSGLWVRGNVVVKNGSDTEPGLRFLNGSTFGVGFDYDSGDATSCRTSIIGGGTGQYKAYPGGPWANLQSGSGSAVQQSFGFLYYASSREAIKERIVGVSQADALTRIAALRPVEFAYKEEAVDLGLNTMVGYNTRRGFIAEEVAAVDHWMAEWGWIDPDDPYKVVNDARIALNISDHDLEDAVPVNYDDRAIVADLVAVVQQMSARLDALEA